MRCSAPLEYVFFVISGILRDFDGQKLNFIDFCLKKIIYIA